VSTNIEVARAEIWNVSAEDYHSDRSAWSHTGLDCFRSSRKRFLHEYILNDLRREPTEAMQFGILLHMALLEPARFESEVIVAPKIDKRYKQGKADWAAFVAESNGKITADLADLDKLRAMQAEVLKHPIAKSLLELEGERETSIRWTCEQTGLPLKCRRDLTVLDPFVVVDVKSCKAANPEAFAKACVTFGYARQAALYIEGTHLHSGEIPRFVFIAVCTEPPHEVATYELDDEAINLGDAQNNLIKRQLAECLKTGEWTAPYENRMNQLSLPRWAYTSDGEYE